MKRQNGITLVAMIVTIIVMLILTGVSINLAIGDNGIINNSQKAAEKTNTSESLEYILEAWGYVLGKYENIELMSNNEFEKVSSYFSKYMSNYGTATIDKRMQNGKDYLFVISCKLKGEEESKIYYIVNDTDVYGEMEFNGKYDIKDFKDIKN